MSLVKRCRGLIKSLVFGDTLLPQEFTIGMVEPNAEIAVWLHGAGVPVDVTRSHSTACSDPFTICIGFSDDQKFKQDDERCLSMRFAERDRNGRVLGEIGLRQTESISLPGMELVLFRAQSAANHCLPPPRLAAHYLRQAYELWRGVNTSGMKMSFLDRRAAIVTFIRPHPVMLVSVVEGTAGNMFPMNVMGELGSRRLAFALKDSRRAAHLVERIGRVALSSVPISLASFAYRLAVNHFRDSIAWDDLPFPTKGSTTFGIPVPAFSPRVREAEVEKVHRIGSHTLFVARLVHEERIAERAELCVIHGFYQAWRLRKDRAELANSVREDSLHKGWCTVEGSSHAA
jgi:flavin reductase (DIM6/NTAB) family NADH-FMN oxidoreductase RutF